MGVSKQTISQYERGVREPDFESLEALCDIFNVSSDYILGKANITMRFLTEGDLELLNRPSLSSDELSLLEEYRELNNEGKTIVLNTVRGLVASCAYKKRETSSASGAS